MTVYLVGAGPGDPGLLTVRGAELLSRADVVIHDRLIDPRLLDLVASDARVIDVGKSAGTGPSQQKAINELLVDHAQRYETVVRLKGGDPFVFGRGGEEARALEAAGCRYEVVSGVSSFASVPAAAGVPLTMRGLSSSFFVVTGHDADEHAGDVATDWDAIGRSGSTIVVLMGASSRDLIADRLMASGRAADTPVLVVENGTTPRQRSERTTLGELGATAVRSPATIVIGDVARCTFAGYEDRPLSSWRVAVTRDVDHSNALVQLLEAAGAEVIAVPAIAIDDPDDRGVALRDALLRLDEFDWVVFTSANAVERVFNEVRDARSFGDVRVGVIGSSTARALYERGIDAEYVPARFVAESFVDEFPRPQAEDLGRVLVPQSATGRDVIEVGLRRAGWQVEVVEAYRTVAVPLDDHELVAVRDADIVTFTSSSSATALLGATGKLGTAVVASIGPITSATARELGADVAIEAEPHTIGGLLDAIITYAGAHPRPTQR